MAYQKAFWDSIRHKNFIDVQNALSVGTDADSGYLVPDEFEHQLIDKLQEENFFRSLATVIHTSGDRKIPVVTGHGEASWMEENGLYPDSQDTFGQQSIGAYKLGTAIRVSEELLNDSVFDLESYIAGEFARRIGTKEEEAFLIGDGRNKPTGVFPSAELGVTANGASITFDDVIDLYHSLRIPYRRKAVWLLNDATIKALRKIIYGYRWKDGELVIQKEEAAIVRKVFYSYLAGKTRRAIHRELANTGVHTMYGNLFQDSTIKQMLQNPAYKGTLVIQKTFVIDPITKHQVINRGEKNKYVVENHHEAIIDADTFNQVQEEMARRKEAGRQHGGYARNYLNTSCFTGIIKCGICGKSYIHNIRKYKGKPSEYWSCLSNKEKAEKRCGAYGAIPQPALERACTSVLGMATFDEDEFLQRVEKIGVPAYHSLIFYLKDGTVIKQPWKSTALKDMWTEKRKKEMQQRMAQYRKSGRSSRYSAFSERIFCPTCDVKFVRCLETRKNRKVAYWRSRNKHKCVHISGIREDWMKETAAALLGESTFDEQIFREQVERIEVQKNRTLVFRFYSGKNKEVKLP
nr:MAG TPA: major capsid protein [Caudoviricetes sp.]